LRIVVADLSFELVSYDPADIAIVVRRGTPATVVMAEIDRILADLSAPLADDRALCFCGDAIPLPPELLAVQQAGRRDDCRQVLRGA
jgi:hypothetical protein